ncbi:MAG: YraN family protein [Chlorobi bacterium]|nr:YraN family protein [Chlorobiota bacterium]
MAQHNDLGHTGEDIAAEYLLGKGYELLEKNWKSGHKEIDLIFRDGDYLVIVEVKTRSSDGWESPKEAVTNKKIRNIIDAAEEYILLNDVMMETRFDIVTLIPHQDRWEIEHIKEAFYP